MFASYDHFLSANVSFFNHCLDRNVHRYATTLELKKKVCALNSQNIKQAIGIQVTFILEK